MQGGSPHEAHRGGPKANSAIMLDRQQKRTFADQGYVVLPRAVPRPLIDAARREVEGRASLEPPPAGHRGPRPPTSAGTAPPPSPGRPLTRRSFSRSLAK